MGLVLAAEHLLVRGLALLQRPEDCSSLQSTPCLALGIKQTAWKSCYQKLGLGHAQACELMQDQHIARQQGRDVNQQQRRD